MGITGVFVHDVAVLVWLTAYLPYPNDMGIFLA
jgi:hypothetical protein